MGVAVVEPLQMERRHRIMVSRIATALPTSRSIGRICITTCIPGVERAAMRPFYHHKMRQARQFRRPLYPKSRVVSEDKQGQKLWYSWRFESSFTGPRWHRHGQGLPCDTFCVEPYIELSNFVGFSGAVHNNECLSQGRAVSLFTCNFFSLNVS